MNYIRNWNIGARLGLGFALVILIAAVVVVFGVMRLGHLNQSLQ